MVDEARSKGLKRWVKEGKDARSFPPSPAWTTFVTCVVAALRCEGGLQATGRSNARKPSTRPRMSGCPVFGPGVLDHCFIATLMRTGLVVVTPSK